MTFIFRFFLQNINVIVSEWAWVGFAQKRERKEENFQFCNFSPFSFSFGANLTNLGPIWFLSSSSTTTTTTTFRKHCQNLTIIIHHQNQSTALLPIVAALSQVNFRHKFICFVVYRLLETGLGAGESQREAARERAKKTLSLWNSLFLSLSAREREPDRARDEKKLREPDRFRDTHSQPERARESQREPERARQCQRLSLSGTFSGSLTVPNTKYTNTNAKDTTH